MITSEQLRAARALLKIDQAEMAKRAGISVETIRRFESLDGELSGRPETILAVEAALGLSGIDFIQDSLGRGVGVRFAESKDKERAALLIARLTGTLQNIILMELDRDPDFFNKGPEYVAFFITTKFQSHIAGLIPHMMETDYEDRILDMVEKFAKNSLKVSATDLSDDELSKQMIELMNEQHRRKDLIKSVSKKSSAKEKA